MSYNLDSIIDCPSVLPRRSAFVKPLPSSSRLISLSILYCSQFSKFLLILSVAVLILFLVSSSILVFSFKAFTASLSLFFLDFISSAFIFFSCSLPIFWVALNLLLFSSALASCSSASSFPSLAAFSSAATPVSSLIFRNGSRTLTCSPTTSASRSDCAAARTMAPTSSVPERILLSAVFTSPSIFTRWFTALCTSFAT